MRKPSSSPGQTRANVPAGLAESRGFRVLSWIVSRWIRSSPYGNRFRRTMQLALAMSMVVWFRERVGLSYWNPAHYARALGMLCLMLHHRRVTYPIEVSIDSDGPMTGPMLMVVRHSLANQLLVRHLVDQHRAVSVLVAPPAWPATAFGSDSAVDAISGPSRMRLRTLANRLRDGRIVFVAIDSKLRTRGMRVQVDTPSGPWFLTDQPARLAARIGVPVASCVVHASRAGVRAEVRYSPGLEPEQLRATCAAIFGSEARLHH